jgi:hypothetical protein
MKTVLTVTVTIAAMVVLAGAVRGACGLCSRASAH